MYLSRPRRPFLSNLYFCSYMPKNHLPTYSTFLLKSQFSIVKLRPVKTVWWRGPVLYLSSSGDWQAEGFGAILALLDGLESFAGVKALRDLFHCRHTVLQTSLVTSIKIPFLAFFHRTIWFAFRNIVRRLKTWLATSYETFSTVSACIKLTTELASFFCYS